MNLRSLHEARTEVARTWTAIRRTARQRGALGVCARIAAILGAHLVFPMLVARRRHKLFEFRGEALRYTLVRYNNTFLNERAVEVSIAKWFLNRKRGRLLEIGNVLSHYGVIGHTVIDRDERIPGVSNEDLLAFRPSELFDYAIAISTLEHIGWDDTPQTPEAFLDGLHALRKCIRPGGDILVTVPIGYNSALDDGLRKGTFRLPVDNWLIRTSANNDWIETDCNEALARQYGNPYPGANALYIGTLE